MWTRDGKRYVLAHAFFKSDLTLPRPPPLLLQDSGVRPQDHGQGRGRYITAVVICGPGIRYHGIRSAAYCLQLTQQRGTRHIEATVKDSAEEGASDGTAVADGLVNSLTVATDGGGVEGSQDTVVARFRLTR